MARWTVLNSPGRATSERAAFELELSALIKRQTRAFLSNVQSDAVAALAGPVVMAGAIPEPFTLGAVLTRWTKVVTSVKTVIATRMHLPSSDPYLSAVERRMLFSPLPTRAHASARAVLTMASSQRWSRATTVRSLAAALNPAAAMVVATVDGLGESGIGWEAGALRIARTEATSAFGSMMLSSLADDPNQQTKTWVSYHDSHTRASHAEADGQSVGINETFIVGGEALMYPGDEGGSPEETYNCRCVMVGA